MYIICYFLFQQSIPETVESPAMPLPEAHLIKKSKDKPYFILIKLLD